MKILQRILNLLLLPLIIFGALFVVKGMIASKPELKPKKKPVVIPRAAFVEASAQTHTPRLKTFGTTRSYNETRISAQVSGKIVEISPLFNAGQNVSRGDLLIEIEPADYLATIAQQEAAVASAQQVLMEEETRSRVAAEDWVDSGRKLSEASDYTLRKPQLAAAKANVASAQAAVAKARLDLERTKIRAPFDAIVSERQASPGNVVTMGTELGTLIARERAEVRLPLTPEQVARIQMPSKNGPPPAEATLTAPSQPGATWTARLTRTEPKVDPQNQVIFVVAEIEDPFANQEAFLPIGAFVNAELAAIPLPNSYRLPATSLVEDSFVWVIDSEQTLRQQKVERLYSEGDYLLARIDKPVVEEPLRVTTRPLASFQVGQTVEPTPFEEANTPAAP
ncbi:efflux RND transporter periplasmic adaptor subunit [Roseibacillus persicicus]|uniref:RND superfamily efflux pump MFP component n=1 Tax=Roseibacillus persicicus TaxID=454148 RepID=A0A918WMV5_9BACT|nr:efflux RND transporter periplasmic adaptor subunit [Roseibacillus persicicus]MDQ8188880.1 efflux RND transporter periplasmic adaptor subunit [Roseibacillus persicicus]GHC64960.1 RND superfamily efflux pump MFP component [Roseibacillus persicicus]